MNTTKYIIPALLSVTVYAQAQNVDQNVTVEREYKPVIQDAGKISSVPSILEPNVQKATAKYTDFNLPLPVGQNIQTLAAAELEHKQRKNPNDAYIRIGLGNYMNNMLDFALPVIKQQDMKLDFQLHHFATFGKDKHSNTNASLLFDNYYKKTDLYAGIEGGYEYFNYYGDTFNKAGEVTDLTTLATDNSTLYKELHLTKINRTAQTLSLNDIANSNASDYFWRFNSFIGLRSLPDVDGWRYDAQVKYKVFDAHNGLTENIIDSKADFNNQYGQNRVGVSFELQNMMYKSDLGTDMNTWDSYSVFSMNPYYSIDRERWNVRLGVKAAFSFVHGKPFNPSPDINTEWKAIPKVLDIYGGIGGGYFVNTLSEMFSENRYLFPDLRIKDTYTPISAYAGFKLKPIYNLLIDGYVNYRYIDNQYFYINKDYAATSAVANPNDSIIYTNRFNVVYSAASLLKFGVRANYNIRSILNIQLKGAYNSWNVKDIDQPWNMPKLEADLAADWKLNKDLTLSSNVFYEGNRYAQLGDMAVKMSPKVDVNLGASYSYLDWFTMFFKVNNILNKHYQNFYGYDVQGLNVMVGAILSF